MPQRIPHALGRKFNLRPAALPSLRTVQNVEHHYRCTRLGRNDKHLAIIETVRRLVFSGREGEHDAYTFTSDYDEAGLPEVGNGSDARSLLVGMTTKTLLQNAARDPGTSVLHLDTTFKLNAVSYPVFVCGITDAARTFHPVALFITSQLQEVHFVAALVALRRMYARVNGAEMIVKYILGDAEKAQRDAFVEGFGADYDFDYFMCFYHVVAKLREKSRGLNGELSALLKMGLLLVQLLECCNHRSMALPKFSQKLTCPVTCPVTLRTRTTGLRRRGLLQENGVTRSSIDFLLGDADLELVHVRAVGPPRSFIPELNRARAEMETSAQFGVLYARMEIEGQPRTRWPVNRRTVYCPCRYYLKMEYCCHLLFVQQTRMVVDEAGDEILVNHKRLTKAGRPQKAGHALEHL
uniref:MULE transposase domain-containing protein n=1 Tax=Phytophthora ramorum TaxID=164328 RepID=H3H4Z0_PHYRM